MLDIFTVTDRLLGEYILLRQNNASVLEIEKKLDEYNFAVKIYNSNGVG